MNKKQIPIRGMHCKSCELLVERELGKVPGVSSAAVNFRRGLAEVYFREKVQDDLIERAVKKAGYEVGEDEKKKWISPEIEKYKDLGWAFLFLVLAYLILKVIGLTDIGISSEKPSSLLVVLLIGLAAGVSTCMALVGGLILGITARHNEKHPEATTIQKFRPHIYFNLSRIFSYAILGGLIGLAGKAFQFSGASLGALTLAVGLVMLLLGLQLIEIFPRLSGITVVVPVKLGKALGVSKAHEKEYSHLDSILLGAISFFLPCGFTQAMQIYAMGTGSFISGALVMGVFALGTTPGLLGIGGLTSVIRGSFSKKFFKFVGLVVVSLAIFNIINAFRLFDIKLSLPTFNASSNNDALQDMRNTNVELVDGIQVARMTEDSRGYSPNRFIVKKGIPVHWIIDAQNIYSCASSLVSRDLKISTVLEKGENIFEFTPEKVGEISFSCSMGMYQGHFKVID